MVGILPVLAYSSPVCANSKKIESYEPKLIKVQKIINIKMATANLTLSYVALCLLTWISPIAIKINEATQLYILTNGNPNKEGKFDTNMRDTHWQHSADTIKSILEGNEEKSLIQIFTDCSKSEKGVGAGIAIYECGHHIKSLHCMLNIWCTNIQAQQLAILTALKCTESMQTRENIAKVYTDSQMTLDSQRYSNIHTYLVEEIWKKLNEMTNRNLEI